MNIFHPTEWVTQQLKNTFAWKISYILKFITNLRGKLLNPRHMNLRLWTLYDNITFIYSNIFKNNDFDCYANWHEREKKEK